MGGLAGIFLVYLLSFMNLGSLDLQLSAGNIILGLGVSSVIGIVSGIVPAFSAARLRPGYRHPGEVVRGSQEIVKRVRSSQVAHCQSDYS